MTIQGALANALSSLAIEQRQADLISNNIANANTPGFVRRELPRTEVVFGGTGSGVASEPIQRASDAALADASRQADGAQSYSQRMTDVLTQYTTIVGQASDSRSISSMMGTLRDKLSALSGKPENAVAQTAAVSAAQDVVDTFHSLNDAITSSRVQADQAINSDVNAVNAGLDKLAANQASLKRAVARGESTAPFEDVRDTVLDDLSKKLPIRTFDQGDGGLVVTTDQGTTIFDGNAHRLSFSAGTSNAPGTSPVTVNGQTIQISDSGSIAANLELRDKTFPKFASQLDQLAGNVIGTFQNADPGVVSSQAAGLFTATDPSAPTSGPTWVDTTDPTKIKGLAGRIGLNAAVDPNQNDPLAAPTDPDVHGKVWRIRDGVTATAEATTAVSDNTLILGFVKGMDTPGSYNSATGMPSSAKLTDAAAQVSGLQQNERVLWSNNNDMRASLAQDAQTSLLNKTGVNIDEEMQRLLIVQQTYSASAQVIQAAAKLLDVLNSIVVS